MRAKTLSPKPTSPSATAVADAKIPPRRRNLPALKLLPEQVNYEARAYSGVQRLAAQLRSMEK